RRRRRRRARRSVPSGPARVRSSCRSQALLAGRAPRRARSRRWRAAWTAWAAGTARTPGGEGPRRRGARRSVVPACTTAPGAVSAPVTTPTSRAGVVWVPVLPHPGAGRAVDAVRPPDVRRPQYDGAMTCRRSEVLKVEDAMWGSLGSRHVGHSTRLGAVAFHCARRCRVLLRDFFRLGTVTSALLLSFSSVG